MIPAFLVNNEFSVKANLFNDFFREQCRSLTNDSSFPNNQIFETVTRFSDFKIDTDTIIKLTRSLDLNGQFSKWYLVEVGLLHSSILGLLHFLVYINDLPLGLRCNAKLFADDTSLFPVIPSSNPKEDILEIAQCSYQWKMSFNPYIKKQAQKIS